MEINHKSADAYLQYQIARLSLKYTLNTDIIDLAYYLNATTKFGSIYNLTGHLFLLNFWKFIFYRKQGFHRLAAKVGTSALDYETTDNDKISSIKKYLQRFNKASDKLKMLNQAKMQKDLKMSRDIQAELDNFDKYLGLCSFLLIEAPNNASLYKKLNDIAYKFEGAFIIWLRLYKNSKTKAKQYKCLEGQEEIDRRDKHSPLYMLSVAFM